MGLTDVDTDADAVSSALGTLGLVQAQPRPKESESRFPDGGAYRIEIPSVESPGAMTAALAEAERLDVPVHRFSQGSGVMLLSDPEITDMVQMAGSVGAELALFIGPRASWDIGVGRTSIAGNVGARARGWDQVEQSIREVHRATELGVKTVLVADEGVLFGLHRLRMANELPPDLLLKLSVFIAPANPLSFQLLQQLGADSINVPSDLTISQLAELRAQCDVPIDFYVEAPEDLGGIVRLYDIAELVRVAAPIYLKFGLRLVPPVYPHGAHMEELGRATARERVRRAHLGLSMLNRLSPQAVMSPRGARDIGPLPRLAAAEN